MDTHPATNRAADGRTLSSEVLGMAASIASELQERWPFGVVHVQVRLSGFKLEDGALPVEDIITLGLTGLTSFDPDRVPSVLAFQSKWMAVRLAGRSLVAFSPQRDFRYTRMDRSHRLQVRAFAAGKRLISLLERVDHRRFAQDPVRLLA